MKDLKEIISIIEDKGYITPLDDERLNSRVQKERLFNELESIFGEKISLRGDYKPDDAVDIYIIINTEQIDEKKVEKILKETRKELLKKYSEY